MSEMLAFNINNEVRVRLTDRGREIVAGHRAWWQDKHPHLDMSSLFPSDDADGWQRWQLWELMKIFGSHLGLGAVAPFETEIRLMLPEQKSDVRLSDPSQ